MYQEEETEPDTTPLCKNKVTKVTKPKLLSILLYKSTIVNNRLQTGRNIVLAIFNRAELKITLNKSIQVVFCDELDGVIRFCVAPPK